MKLVLLLAVVAMALSAQGSQVGVDEGLGVLKVLGVRKMTDEEIADRVVDFAGVKYVMRLRFEAPKTGGVFLYSAYCTQPLGFRIEKVGDRRVWLRYMGSSQSQLFESPGFDEILRMAPLSDSCWMRMISGAAYEWESEVVENGSIDEARSVFVKLREKEKPVEIISSWFNIAKEIGKLR
ncbi:MAG TPA: hypothetical protein VFY29_08120 [Terriglobia bacterium]|nr:hypothetical protein [Terriglobia bacterium]